MSKYGLHCQHVKVEVCETTGFIMFIASLDLEVGIILSHLISSLLISSHLISILLFSSLLFSPHHISSHHLIISSSHLFSSLLFSSLLFSSLLFSSHHLISSHLIFSYLALQCQSELDCSTEVLSGVLPTSCADVQTLLPTALDGEYKMKIGQSLALVYCHNMNTSNPLVSITDKEYICLGIRIIIFITMYM